MKIYFVRHGLVDYDTAQLSADGRSFATALPNLINSSIDFIACDEEQRCRDTIATLARAKGAVPKYYSKLSFEMALPLNDCPKDGTSVICYRIETVNPLLHRLHLPTFTNANRDTAYQKILVYADGVVQEIRTGYGKA